MKMVTHKAETFRLDKKAPNIHYFQETHIKYKDINSLKVKGQRKI
jgi:hypothetical protein